MKFLVICGSALFLLLIISSCIPSNLPHSLIKIGGIEGLTNTENNTLQWIPEGEKGGAVVMYECRKDGGAWYSNGLETTYVWDSYSEGLHSFEVRAKKKNGTYSETLKWLFEYADKPDLISWQKCLGGSGFEGLAGVYTYNSIQLTADGGYIVAGTTDSKDGDVSNNKGKADFWVTKLDSKGSLVWEKSLGGSEDDVGQFVIETADGGYVVVGYTSSTDGDVTGNHGNSDIWVIKLDQEGNLIWQKCFGGADYDIGQSVLQTGDGGFIVAGMTRSNNGDVSGNNGDWDIWVLKLDESGNLIWQKCLGGSGTDVSHTIQQTTDGGFAIAGFTSSDDGDVSGNRGGFDIWVIKLDETGNVSWQKCLGGSGNDWGRSIQQTNDGGYIVAGSTSSVDGDVERNTLSAVSNDDVWLVKLDDEGNIEWQSCFGGAYTDLSYSVTRANNGGYAVIGFTESNDGHVEGNHGGRDIWIVRVDDMGSLVWQKCLGGTGTDMGYFIQNAEEGYVIVGQTDSNDGDVEGNHGNIDIWVVKLL